MPFYAFFFQGGGVGHPGVWGIYLKILKEIESETHRKDVGCVADLFTFCVPCSDIQMC